ncbi:hypothetical protein OG906_41320 (plasmid) [Streptomyces sp. NBC_01426]|uniref:hypothetical protein n=1 Tax=Streptomyces sp. NBC_01426 TaxID=2975866 RepID=UPI002E322833|nr:hypothetical protein [Streptomyces sp. NBC_01426]
MMDNLNFDEPIGSVAVSPRDNSLLLVKALGTHTLQLTLDIHVPKAPEAGRVLVLETSLQAPHGNGMPIALAASNATLALRPDQRTDHKFTYTLTNAQLRALEENRSGDLRLEITVRAVLPQAAAGLHPGSTDIRLYLTVAESSWKRQLEGLGPSLAVEMSVPFPAADEPRREAVQYLLSAQSRLRGAPDIDGALLDVRRTLEYIRENSGWPQPSSKKQFEQYTKEERWAATCKALERQASGALHKDVVTKEFTYTREEAETMIAATAALLRLI